MYDEVLFTVEADKAERVDRVSMADLGLEERKHLQEWIISHPEVLGAGVKVITSEYDRWQTSSGAPVLDRLDVLAVEPPTGDLPYGRLIVVELKRDTAPHTIHMQAINYAAMVSRLTPEDIADLYVASHSSDEMKVDAGSVQTELETELALTQEGIRRSRIVLIASDFPPSVTASVVWLSEQQVDISLIRFRTYKVAEQTVVSFNRFFPVPDVEEFTIGRRTSQSISSSQAPTAPWDEAGFRRLRDQGNPATLALLELCSSDEPGPIGVKEIAQAAGISDGSVRGQLAGLTMRLKNPRYGFLQRAWPVRVTWLPGGIASYSMDAELSALWRHVRDESHELPTVEQVDS